MRLLLRSRHFGIGIALSKGEQTVPLIPQILCGEHTGEDAHAMKNTAMLPILFPRQFAVLMLASAIAIPLSAQQPQPAGDPQSTPPAVQQQPTTSVSAAKEGFWGRVNPIARKKWVKRQTDPINDRLSELDEANAKNARDIRDVDSRAQAGIHQAQSTADAANQAAMAAGTQAQNANGLALDANGHVVRLNSTIAGLDQYRQVSEVDVLFRSGLPALSSAARTQLDELAASLNGHQGYILEMEAHSPHAGSAGIQNSERLAEAVKRYLVSEHQIPVYRLHSVALGNAEAAATGAENSKPARTSIVHVRLMENSLAAQSVASPHGAAGSTGAERP
jgi:outer membrane protein OmpA-like peptidoglycan-associated protein